MCMGLYTKQRPIDKIHIFILKVSNFLIVSIASFDFELFYKRETYKYLF